MVFQPQFNIVLCSRGKLVQFSYVLFKIETVDIDINDERILESERNIWKDLVAAQTINRKVGLILLTKYSSSVNVFEGRANNVKNNGWI